MPAIPTMTDAALPAPARGPGLIGRLMSGKTGPVLVVSLVLIAFWYVMTVYMNADWAIQQFERKNVDWSFGDLVTATMEQKRPQLPAPHQILAELEKSVLDRKVTSKRSLIYHAGITLSSTMLGFLFGTVLGILLAVGIVHQRTMEKSMMPWVICSQTIPILAIAPMIIVVLAAIGLRGLVPKAFISMYLCFFPVAIGMVKGLRSPDLLQLDLMRTYSASRWTVFWSLRWPSAMPYLFTSLKIGIAIALVGAIVGELPTGALGGIGSRLLAGSYYGQTIQIWAALLAAAVLAGLLVSAVGLVEKLVYRRMGVQS